MRYLAMLAVTLAVIATLLFNASYGYSRGATPAEQTALVLVAVIIDLGKSTFLAGAAHLASHGYRGRATLLTVLWLPCFVLSTWAGYAFIAASRAETAASKSATADTRSRAESRYADARRQLQRITDGPLFAATAGCSAIKTKDQRTVCSAYDTARQELDRATTALTTAATTGGANPEVRLLAQATKLPTEQIEIVLAFIPALLLELMASLGVYALYRPTPKPTPTAKAPARPAEAVLPPDPTPPPPPAPKPVQPPPRAPAATLPPARATLRPRTPNP